MKVFNTLMRIMISLLFLITFSFDAEAQPVNDDACDAITITVDNPEITGDNTNATGQASEPSCYDVEHTMWYKFVVPNTCSATISTDFPSTTLHDTEISLYSVTDCSDFATYTQIDCDQDSGNAIPSGYTSIIIASNLTAGATYYVVVNGYNSGEGEFKIEVTTGTNSCPPTNDLCANATTMVCGNSLTGESTVNGTDNGDDTGCGMGKGVWYEFVGTGADVTVTVTNESTDVELSISSSSDCTTFANIACEDTPETGTFTSVLGTTYYFYVGHAFSSTSTGTFDIAVTCACIPPTATYTVVEDCGNDQFSIDVNVTGLGDGSAVDISNDGGVSATTNVGTGLTTVGPFAAATPIIVTVDGSSYSGCSAATPSSTMTGCLNDDCSTAVSLTVETCVCTPGGDAIDMTLATNSLGAPLSCNAGFASTGDLWYSVIIPPNGTAYLRTGQVVGSDLTDTWVELYESTCDGTEISCQDDDNYTSGGETQHEEVTITGTPGATILARVGVAAGSDGDGEFYLCAYTLIAATFTPTCAEDLTYSLDVNITSLGNAASVKITNGGGDLQTGITTTGIVTLTGLSGAETYSVINEANASCSVSMAIPACSICDIPGTPSDDCATATSLNLSQAFMGSTDCFYTPSLSESSASGCGSIQNDSWFIFTAGATSLDIDWDITGGSSCTGLPSSTGVQISIYPAASGCGAGFDDNNIACLNPTGGIGSSGAFNITGLTVGDEYFMRIDGFAGDKCDYSITPQGGVAVLPDNDLCADAEVVTCASSVTADNIFATSTDAPTGCTGGGTPNLGIWYKFVGTGETVTLSTDDAGTSFNTEINVYSGSCGALVCVGGDDDGGTGTTSSYTFTSVLSTDYYIYVDGVGGATGAFVLSVTCVPTCGSSFVVLAASGTSTANAQCDDGDWTYYYNPAAPADMLFAINWAPDGSLSAANATAKVGASITIEKAANSNDAINGAIQATYAMSRYWNVTTAPTFDEAVNVKFFYDPAEKTDVTTDATNFATTNGVPDEGFIWFKTTSGAYDHSDNTAPGITNSIALAEAATGMENGITFVQFDGLTSFSGGTGAAAAGDVSVLLPIELISFSGDQKGDVNLLEWATASEKNTERMIVERSANGLKNWEAIGEVAAYGTTDEKQYYELEDARPLNLGYYRLKSIDFDGTFQLSNVISIRRAVSGFEIANISPNPTKDVLNIGVVSGIDTPTTLILRDITGREIQRYEFETITGDNNFSINLNDVSNGIYLLTIENNTHRLIEKIVKN